MAEPDVPEVDKRASSRVPLVEEDVLQVSVLVAQREGRAVQLLGEVAEPTLEDG
eukprot:CAMPEP_0205879082 /NCGR_PEP_ID=MMETSP1083-20121108/15204_1 /ASSEMBLY_ACC=CAM_ASM_000430 /TAXON_ID=97485 /ORGANISM="Prymnesium parvum, Strain Texoma1" /LENGTH=53 /DNA_ID=CAMNT_0053242011 /DNA_START=1097 /DNA_END=1258 /DNA_ORIENTATION=+